MLPDRFETELRAALRADAGPMTGTMSAAELHARAASRSRWTGVLPAPRFLSSTSVGFVGIVVLAVVVLVGRPGPGPVASGPPVVGRSASPAAASASMPPSPRPTSFVDAHPGALIVARPTATGLQVVAVDSQGGERSLGSVYLPSTPGPLWHRDDTTAPNFAYANGQLVVSVVREVPGSAPERGNAWFDLTDPAWAPTILPGGWAMFDAGGDLVLAPEGPDGVTKISLIRRQQRSYAYSTNLPAGVRLEVADRGRFDVTRDGTGVFVTSGDPTANQWKVLRWNDPTSDQQGTPSSVTSTPDRSADLTGGRVPMVSVLGSVLERSCVDPATGVRSRSTLTGDDCAYEWVGDPGGRMRIKIFGDNAVEAAWATNAEEVIAIDKYGRVFQETRHFQQQLGTLSTPGKIVGMTDSSVYVEGRRGEGSWVTTRLALAPGSPEVVTDGLFVGIAP